MDNFSGEGGNAKDTGQAYDVTRSGSECENCSKALNKWAMAVSDMSGQPCCKCSPCRTPIMRTAAAMVLQWC